LLTVAACAACGSPPEKEYHQAVGAIEAARAAGAGTYAPEELTSAEQALTRYDAAVDQRDYRQALSHALDARERATAAAAKAASDKALFRGEAERQISALTATVARAQTTAAGATRAQAQAARTLRQAIAATERVLQEARAALGRDDVMAARKALEGAEARLAEALTPFAPGAPAPAPARR
jgi:hypothetical protein